MYGSPVQMPRQTSAQMQDEIMARRLALAQQNARSIVSRYNRDPRSMNPEEADMAQQLAEQFGYSTAQGRKRDKPRILQKGAAFAGGAIDAALFDILKDEWYAARGTGDYKKAGKIAGLVGSIAIGVVPGAAKAAGGVAKSVIPKMAGVFGQGKTAELVGKALTVGAKYGTVPGVSRGIAGAARGAITSGQMGNAFARGIRRFAPATVRQSMMTGQIPVAVTKYAPTAALAYGGMRTLGNAGRYVQPAYDPNQMLPQIPLQQQY